MGNISLNSGAEYTSLKAVVTRKDGTVEDLGTIAFNHRNPFKVAKWEHEKFGKVNEDTALRCAKYAAPYAAGAVVGLASIALAYKKYM